MQPRKRKRVGRGPGSGTGKIGGRGIKGQKSRSGVAIDGYEGGQMPLYQRLPKRGFTKPNRKKFAVINLGILQKFIDAKKIDAKKPITEDVMVESGLVRRKLDGIRVLAKGEFSAKIQLSVTGASQVRGRGRGQGRRLADGHNGGSGRIRGCERRRGRLHPL